MECIFRKRHFQYHQSMNKFKFFGGCMVALLCAPPPALAAPDMPALMILGGRIAPGAGLKTTAPAQGDAVLAFSAVDGQLVGSGPVSAGGEYAAILMRTASFNGTAVALELQQGRKRFQLLDEGGAAWLIFRGKILPERTALALRVGSLTAELSAVQAANPQAQRLSQHPDVPCSAELDVNGDGQCDALDWEIAGLYGGGVLRSIAHPDSE